MKNNTLTLKDDNGEKKDYRILLDIEDTTNKINYVIYTDDETVHCTVKSFSESALVISYTEGSSTREDYFVKQ